MNMRPLLGCGVLGVLLLVAPARAQRGGAARAANLEMEVQALNRLHDLEVTQEQLKDLKKLAAKVTPAKAPQQGKTPPAYVSALAALRGALASDDEAKIADAQDKVDQLRDEQEIDPQTDVKATDSARRQAAAVLNLATASQIANYISERSDEVPDPVATLMDALDELRDGDYEALKAEASSQVAVLLAGFDPADQEPIRKKAADWLDRAKAMSDDQLKRNRGQLEQSARAIVGQIDPVLQLRHWLEQEIAELLSNPELPAALTARIK